MRDLPDAQSVAQLRGSAPLHRSARTTADPDAEDRIGAAGEREFAKVYGLDWDTRPKPHGDDGIDFTVTVNGRRITIDVKTSRKPLHLLVKVADMRHCADLLVLVRYLPNGEARLLGWETKGIMSVMPIDRFGDFRCYYRPRALLRPMFQLGELLRPTIRRKTS